MIDALTNFRLQYMEALAKSWQDTSFKEAMLESNNLLEFLDDQYGKGIKDVWPNVKIELTDKIRAIWAPEFLGGWVGDDDLFTIYIPNKPEDEAIAAEALAAYGTLFPTFMGRQSQGEFQNTGIIDESFLKFGAITLQVIGILWRDGKDSDFHQELFSSEDGAALVLSKYLSHKNPWGFRLKFKLADEDKFTYDPVEKTWKDIQPNEVTLHYPEKPQLEKDLPIALATYNSNYDVYPFTCC